MGRAGLSVGVRWSRSACWWPARRRGFTLHSAGSSARESLAARARSEHAHAARRPERAREASCYQQQPFSTEARERKSMGSPTCDSRWGCMMYAKAWCGGAGQWRRSRV